MWEVVRGYAESENLALEAQRELNEEFGYPMQEIGESEHTLGVVYPNSGLLTTEITVYASLGSSMKSAEWLERLDSFASRR